MIKKSNSYSNNQIVLGLGGTVDYEVEIDEIIIEKLAKEYDISIDDLEKVSEILDERDLLISILSYIRLGIGGEKFVHDSENLKDFSKHFKKKVSLGGTCVRAGIIQSKFGKSCVLHLVSISEEVRELLPSDISYVCSADHDTLDPHLIIQFREGFEVKIKGEVIKARQPSRIIFTNDPPNRNLVIAEELGEVLADTPLFLISGLNCIQDLDVLEVRINELEKHMKNLPETSIVIFEDAGYHKQEICMRALELLDGLLDIFGMNEDELQNYLEREIDLLDVTEVYEAIMELAPRIPAPLMIIHTRYWSIAYGEDADKYRIHLQAAIDVASTRFCFGENIGMKELRETQQNPRLSKSLEFSRELEDRFVGEGICLPGYELKVKNPTTIGLGDVFVGGLVGSLSGIKF